MIIVRVDVRSGKFRSALNNQPVYPRPLQEKLPVWLGVGGTLESFVRAGTLGLPLMVAVIGGETHRFRPLIDLYREAGSRAGFSPDQLKVGLHSPGYVGETNERQSRIIIRAMQSCGQSWAGNAAGHL